MFRPLYSRNDVRTLTYPRTAPRFLFVTHNRTCPRRLRHNNRMARSPLKLPTQAALNLAKDTAQRLGTLSQDPQVRREAANVAQAVQRLLAAVRDSKPHQ